MSHTGLWQLRNVEIPGRLTNVNCLVHSGVTAVIGPSGAGKTSFLKLLVEFIEPTAGQCNWQSHSPTADRHRFFWSGGRDGLWTHLTVEQHLAAVAPATADMTNVLAAFDLIHIRTAHIHQLSSGEADRLSVARAVAANPHVLVLDEPLVHVDPSARQRYWDFIAAQAAAQNLSLIVATHDTSWVLKMAKRVIVMEATQVTYANTVASLYWSPPTPAVGAYLGPLTWLTDKLAAAWVSSPSDHSITWPTAVRPEQLELVPDENGHLVTCLNDAIGSGEARLIHRDAIADPSADDDPKHSLVVHYRPNRSKLAVGQRVAIRLMAILCLMLSGSCQPASERILPIAEVTSWTLPPEDAKLPSPRAVTVGRNNEYYVLDTAGRVVVLNADGKAVRQWQMPDRDVGKPEGICQLASGLIAVADTHYHRVILFDEMGKEQLRFGQRGKGPGEFIYPVAITTDPSGDLFVCEYGGNDRVQRFSPTGEFQVQFGHFGTGTGQFQRPSGIAWDSGLLYVVDAFNNRVQVFEAESGKLVNTLPSGNDSLLYPYDIVRGQAGELLIVEYSAGRVAALKTDGQVVGRFGKQGRQLGELTTPWGLTFDGRRIIVADTGNRRLAVWSLPR